MDALTLATTVTTCLAPALPDLIKAGDKGAEAPGEKPGAEAGETAKAIWQRLGSSPSVEAAAREVAKAPDDEAARVALRYQIQKLLAADDSLATALAQLVEAVARPTRS